MLKLELIKRVDGEASWGKSVMIESEMGREFASLLIDQLILFEKKQHDYGSGNITAIGEQGVLYRTIEKVERIKNLIKLGHTSSVQLESIDDSWMDIANFAVIAQLLRKQLWK